MKRKEMSRLLGEAGYRLASVSDGSAAVIGGRSYPIHQIAHGAGIAYGLAKMLLDGSIEAGAADELVAKTLNAAIQWEADHGVIEVPDDGADGGDGDE